LLRETVQLSKPTKLRIVEFYGKTKNQKIFLIECDDDEEWMVIV
jgi:hypothetical protein